MECGVFRLRFCKGSIRGCPAAKTVGGQGMGLGSSLVMKTNKERATTKDCVHQAGHTHDSALSYFLIMLGCSGSVVIV